MNAVKDFIYLDEYKMYSISSQIFEGITEYLIDYQEDAKEEEEPHPIPTGSGRIIADILKSESGTQEKKYLHDYSYTLFEDYLKEEDKILSFSAENIDEQIDQIDNAGFVKVRAKAIFNDMNILQSTIKNMNELGKALAYILNFTEIEKVRQQFEKAAEHTKDRNQKTKLRQQQKNMTNIRKLAKELGFNLDDDFINNLGSLLKYGFQDQFIVQMPIGQYVFSADCKRGDLREDEHLLVRKYSRIAEKEFVLVGTVAQSSNDFSDYAETGDEGPKPQHIKEAIMFFVEKLTVMESSFFGRLADEIIIDPIALYREI